MKNIFIFMFVMGISFCAKASITVSPGFVYFGSVKINSGYATQTASVMNNSEKPAQVSVSDGCYGSFSMNSSCFGALSPYGSCQIMLSFHPQSKGMTTCSFGVQDSTGSYTSVNVSGTGY